MYKMIFMVPHPDDEILACTYWLQLSAKYQYSVQLVYFTDGENDLLGEMLAYCNRIAYKVNDLYVGTAAKIVQNDGKFLFFYTVLVMDENRNPISKATVNAVIGGEIHSGVTNELGFICFSKKTKISSLTVNDLQISKNMWRSVPATFHKKYGEIRFQESVNALNMLGVKANIIQLHMKDGSLKYLDKTQKEGLMEKLRVLVSSSKEAMILFPHERDIDSDHYAISSMVKEISEKTHTLLRYMVHNGLNHKLWPDPKYSTCREDRLKAEYMSPPLTEEKFIEKSLNIDQKKALLHCFKTQIQSDEFGFLLSFAKKNEFYYPVN